MSTINPTLDQTHFEFIKRASAGGAPKFMEMTSVWRGSCALNPANPLFV